MTDNTSSRLPSTLTLEDHPIAAIFPLLPEHELEALAEDVKERGVEVPIVLYEGKILDGRNRYRAAMQSGVHFQTNYYTGDNPVKYVLSLNLHRRHLTESQRQMVAAKIASMPNGGDRKSDHSANLHSDFLTAEQAADMLNVGRRGVFEAKAILRDAPEQVAAIESGEKTVHQVRQELKPHVVHNTGCNEWYTPPEFIELARKVMGEIDLDPASCAKANETVKAKQFFGIEDDGLRQVWRGRVWLNPPYESGLIERFVSKLLDETELAVTEAICLTNNATETGWGNVLVSSAKAICFPKGRIKFHTPEGPKATGLQGQMICYFGKQPELFRQVYESIGPVKT